MTKDEKYYKLAEIFSDKTESFGCKVMDGDGNIFILQEGVYIESDKGNMFVYHFNLGRTAENYGYKIIGHPVMIGDVLDGYRALTELNIKNRQFPLEELDKIYEIENNILIKWKKKRKPLEDQSEELYDYLLSLVEKAND